MLILSGKRSVVVKRADWSKSILASSMLDHLTIPSIKCLFAALKSNRNNDPTNGGPEHHPHVKKRNKLQ